MLIQSIVRRMRETMKDMMSPSWLVDLVHSVRKPSRSSHPAQSMNNIGQQVRPGLYAGHNFCQSHIFVDTWMVTVNPVYKL